MSSPADEDRPAYVTAFNTLTGQGTPKFHASPRVPVPVYRRPDHYQAECGQHVGNVTREAFTRNTIGACPACLGLLVNAGLI